MKHSTSLIFRLSTLASVALLASGAANAQTFYYQNAGSAANAAQGGGTAGGTLSTIGFDLSQWDRAGSVSSDLGAASLRPDVAGPGQPYDINFIASSLASQAPAGTQLGTVTLYLYATVINPDGAAVNFSIYDGYQSALGNNIGTLSLAGPANENAWFSLTFTADQFAGGAALASPTSPLSVQLDLQSELSTLNSGSFTPGVSATFVPIVVPEPSAALLGGVGALALFRRRRA